MEKNNVIYHMSVTLKTIQKATLENKYSAKHIVLDDITVVDRLRELKIYLNKDLYLLAKNSLVKPTPSTAEATLQKIKETIHQMKIPVFNLNNKNEVEKGQVKKPK